MRRQRLTSAGRRTVNRLALSAVNIYRLRYRCRDAKAFAVLLKASLTD